MVQSQKQDVQQEIPGILNTKNLVQYQKFTNQYKQSKNVKASS